MTTRLICIGIQAVMFILTGVINTHWASASEDQPLPSRPASVRISVSSYERIPIATLLAHPDRYQMRDIRITGTVMVLQTEIITNRMVCGRAHERTTLMLEDDSGRVEVIDQGACGKNVGALRAPMLKTGQQIDLLVQIMISTGLGTPNPSVEATIRYIDLAQD